MVETKKNNRRLLVLATAAGAAVTAAAAELLTKPVRVFADCTCTWLDCGVPVSNCGGSCPSGQTCNYREICCPTCHNSYVCGGFCCGGCSCA